MEAARILRRSMVAFLAVGAATAVAVYPQAVIETANQLQQMARGETAPPKATTAVVARQDVVPTDTGDDVAAAGSVEELTAAVAGPQDAGPEDEEPATVIASLTATQADADTRQIEIEAARRIGYVPLGGLESVSELDVASQALRILSEDVRLVGPVDIETPLGSWRLAGLMPFGLADNCKNTEGEEYDCLTWAHEGMRLLVDAGPLRCLPVAGEGGATPVAQCSVLVGGEWFDLSEWGVLTGMALADPEGDLVPFQRLAQDARTGVWSGTFRVFGAPEIDLDVTNIAQPEGFESPFRDEPESEI